MFNAIINKIYIPLHIKQIPDIFYPFISCQEIKEFKLTRHPLFRKGIGVKAWQEEQEGIKATVGILSAAGKEGRLSGSGGRVIARCDHFCHCSGRQFRRSAWN